MRKVIVCKDITLLTIGAFFFLCIVFLWNKSVYCESVRGVTDTTIKIGAILDQTGPTAGDIALPVTGAVRNYTQYINDSGGIFGRKLKVIVEDDRYSIPAGVAAFKKLLFKDKVLAFIGPASTGEAKTLIPQIEKLKVPNMTGSPSKTMIVPLKRYIFLAFNVYEDQLGVIFDYLVNDLQPEKLDITLVYFDTESGKVALTATKKWAGHFNLSFDTEIINMGALDATSQVMSIKRKKPTHIVMHHTSPATVALLRDLKKYGVDVPVYGTLPTCAEDTVRMAGSASKNYIGVHGFSSWYEEAEGVKKMRRITLKYQADADKQGPNRFYTAGWILTSILYEGIRMAGKDLTIEKLVTSLESIRNMDTKGIVGPITFTPTKHKGLDHCKLYRADPATGRLVAITEWRKAPDIKE
ncbi:MAG: ABC transporter substrate-binding protein [Thermodesulfobacteriota bacterium]|nr:ABC transporter substrate-binding protein [Thermodesulfobacteriota bacterium]